MKSLRKNRKAAVLSQRKIARGENIFDQKSLIGLLGLIERRLKLD